MEARIIDEVAHSHLVRQRQYQVSAQLSPASVFVTHTVKEAGEKTRADEDEVRGAGMKKGE